MRFDEREQRSHAGQREGVSDPDHEREQERRRGAAALLPREEVAVAEAVRDREQSADRLDRERVARIGVLGVVQRRGVGLTDRCSRSGSGSRSA
jgi:hypothetical protein